MSALPATDEPEIVGTELKLPRRKSAWSDEWVKNWRVEGDVLDANDTSHFLKLALGKKRPRRQSGGPFDIRIARLREIEAIIRHRHGPIIPETDDGDLYILAAAYALNALCYSRDEPDLFPERLRGWCHRFAPWALRRAAAVIGPILRKLHGRKYDLSADEVARVLNIRLIDRMDYGFKTIGGCDVTPTIRQKIAANKKRKHDKARQAAKRLKQGRRPHSQSLSQTKPWEAEGISRRTWERRRKAVAGSAPHDADMSPVGITTVTRDTFASSATVAGSAPTVKGSSLLISGHGSDSAARLAGRVYVENNSKAWDRPHTPVTTREVCA